MKLNISDIKIQSPVLRTQTHIADYIGGVITHYENQMYRLTTDIGYSFHKLYDYDANVYYLIYANNLFWNFQYPVFLVGNWSFFYITQ